MERYYEETSEDESAHTVLAQLDRQHQDRLARLDSMAAKAHAQIWYPFTQHALLTPTSITAIDSAHGDFFQTLRPAAAQAADASAPLLQASFDGSASWWTQGLGHANPRLTLAAAYAAGRYGHSLLACMHNPRLARVFFSDNGSTGCEVAVKMGLRAARVRYGWGPDEKLGVLGLKGSYHGDTIGAMDCAEPCTFNEKVEWYEGKGAWLDYPTVRCSDDTWHVDVPEALREDLGRGEEFDALADIFDVEARERGDEGRRYERYIEATLAKLQKQGHKFGALMLEPVILGAGGMLFVDPLFQRTLVNVVRRSPHLFATSPSPPSPPADPLSWSGLPVVFDEVFTGLYRLGRYTASSFLGVHADVSVHAKLLTGGLVPLCTTLASESIFEAFASEDKSDALLHGHSYTAHPIGCQVALESLQEMQRMEEHGSWDWAKAAGWTTPTSPSTTVAAASARTSNDGDVWSMWPHSLITAISQQTQRVHGVWALGSVLAITLHGADGAGYKSTAAQALQARLREGNVEEGWNVHARVLGNVFYVMAGQKTSREDVEGVATLLREALEV
ncbi:hypothetical protein G7046_g9999 [Stylonectria norvegica]|nr:hypothetical protein G7046_g9999 [Stylonectria norvegica]